MNHQFTLTVDPIYGTGNILLNGQAIFLQSQLQICTTQNFFDWYQDLPSLMFAEVNDNYSVTVECLDIQYDLLCAVFSTVKECQSLKQVSIKANYSTEQRFLWLTEAAAKANTVLPDVPNFSIQAAGGTASDVRTVVDDLPAFYRGYYAKDVSQVNVWLATQNSMAAIPRNEVTDNDIVLCDTAQHTQIQFSQVPLLHRSRSTWCATISVWIDQMILLPYLLHCQEMLLKQKKSRSFEIESRLQMLSRDEPYVKLTLPSRIETGTACPIAIEEFPPSNLSLRVSDPDLLALNQNNQLLAKKPGHASVAILSEKGGILQKKDLDIYRVNRVTSISLTSGKGNTVLVGDAFTVRADCRPQGAENLSKAVWSVSPDNALKNIGGGQFSAQTPGTCTVTLTVEKASQSIQLTVVPLAADIRLPPEVRVKVNAAPRSVSAALLPSGSACREIRCSIADGNIAQWNPNTKSVVPISEGNTRLEAIGIGPTGNILFRKSCPVVILPEKNIVTPPTLLTLAICCGIIALLTGRTVFAPLALLGCGVLFGVSAVVNGISWIRRRGTLSNKLQTIIATVGFILSILMLIAFT